MTAEPSLAQDAKYCCILSVPIWQQWASKG